MRFCNTFSIMQLPGKSTNTLYLKAEKSFMTRFQLRKKLQNVGYGFKTKTAQDLSISQIGATENYSKFGIRKTAVKIATVAFLTIATTQAANAAAMRTGFNANNLERDDDVSTGLVDIGFDINFFGISRNQLYVNNNGNVTFDNPLGAFTPFDLTATNRQIIAPFFADVDTRNPSSGLVSYGTGNVDGKNAFGVNWKDVGYYNSKADKLNSFQLVLVDRSDTGAGNFDIEFNYDQIQWETGDFSGGTGGLGGNSARAGYSNGTRNPGTSFELAGSGVNGAFLDGGSNSLAQPSNKKNSRQVFIARNGSISSQPSEPVPEPITILGTLTAGGIGAAMRRKSKQRAKATA
jgi:hypothetical protein